ncbi:DUF2069 domain-containing protein|uniref:DUF2069 domain-containing protein n=1 Tax=Noviherbaspirillum sp. L7-7A TaxID=2850560 RepID=UPI001C2B93E8|nr:DUF2069 domain-containing protein [Noviherbaspirillum sp. L7-7A]MBV0879520.1 DUF2069 domain-containing protein [Noviherbaspirillum sp. L7-7A]
MQSPAQKGFYFGAVGSLVVLIILCALWETVLAPLRPGGSWLVLKIIPLLLPLRGIIKRDIYTLQWSSMLILIYLAEGSVRAYTDTGISAWLAYGEIALVGIFFLCSLLYLRPYKKSAKMLARQVIKKASESVNE